MSILRAPRPETGWYALDKRISEDKRLGWAARGLLIYLLGKPDNWQVSIEDLRRQTLAARARTGRDGIYGLLRELQEAGYITAVPQARREDGTLGPVEYVVRESPLTGQPDTAQPDTAQPEAAEPYAGQPDTAEPTQTKTDSKQGLKEHQGLSESEAPRKRGTRLPQDWMPDPSAQERLQAKHPGIDLVTELEKFRDYWAASSSAKAVKADWQAAWRFWLRNAEEFAKRNPRAGKPAGAITRDTRSEEELEHHNFAELERFGLETAA